ncbi:MAG: radical SAM protein [Clostridia bacterium]|nr:radical SAM protein [Clostridia bacterium]
MKEKHIIIPVFIPNKGCPFDCIFCNQKTISGQLEEMTINKMISVIEEHLTSINQKHSKIEIAFYGGSFTGIEKSQQIEFLKVADKYVRDGIVSGVRLSTRPDYISNDILDYLEYYNVKTIELGVQSLDDEVLQKTCRGHSAEDVTKAVELIKKRRFILGIQTMIGLPGDTKEKAIATAKRVVGFKPEIIRIYPTLVIKNTFLEKLYLAGDYTPIELEQAVELCAELLKLYDSYGLNVIRVGLQPSDSINTGMDVIAGPFHPAFRHLVESRLILNEMMTDIRQKRLDAEERIIIYTSSRSVSDIVGQKRCNIEKLKAMFGFSEIKVELRDEMLEKKYTIEKY